MPGLQARLLTELGLDGLIHPRFYKGDLTAGDRSCCWGTVEHLERSHSSLRVHEENKNLGRGLW